MRDLAKIGVLVMAYGSPAGPDAVAGYYTHIRRGRAPEPHALAELEARYEAIGRSPLAEITRCQAEVLVEHLNRDESGTLYLPFVGYKHASPFVEDAVAAMRASGVERFVAIAMAPHYSTFSIDAYLQRSSAAARHAGLSQVAAVRRWSVEAGFVEYWAQAIRHLAATTTEASVPRAVVFTAHSLPRKILAQGDPYPAEVEESARAVAGAAGILDYALAWQSAGRTDEPWLGPAVDEVLGRLCAEGFREFVICPLGFVADHLEVLYDDDVACRRLIESRGATYRRVPMPNADPGFLAAAARAVRRALANASAAAA